MNQNLMMAQTVVAKQYSQKNRSRISCPVYQKPVPVSVVAGAGCFISRKGNEKDRPYRSRASRRPPCGSFPLPSFFRILRSAHDGESQRSAHADNIQASHQRQSPALLFLRRYYPQKNLLCAPAHKARLFP